MSTTSRSSYNRDNDKISVPYGRQNRRWNARHLDLAYCEGDLERLETLGQCLAALLAHQQS
jgi:hypothetical protein